MLFNYIAINETRIECMQSPTNLSREVLVNSRNILY